MSADPRISARLPLDNLTFTWNDLLVLTVKTVSTCTQKLSVILSVLFAIIPDGDHKRELL